MCGLFVSSGDDVELDDDGRTARASDYRQARIGAASSLIAILLFLLVIDALRPDYTIDNVIFGGLVTTIVTLLGIEAGAVIRGRK
jgi:hypothetical protein